MTHIEDWQPARQLTLSWLKDAGITASKLAARAGVERSVVSRFLRGQSLSPQSAVKLAGIMQRSLTASERLSLITAFGLSAYSELAQPFTPLGVTENNLHFGQPEERLGYVHRVWHGARLMTMAAELSAHSWDRAVPLLFAAEQSFGHGSAAAMAALTAVQVLINLGDLNQAEREIVRVEGMYGDEMDTITTAQAASMHGWLDFDRGDLQAASRWFKQNLRVGQEYRLPSFQGEAHHFIALCELGLARQLPNGQERTKLLRLAEQRMHLSTAFKKQCNEAAAVMGFEHFRLSQVLDAQGRYADAQAHRRKSQLLFDDHIAVNHIQIHSADHALEDGDTATARRNGQGALEMWAAPKYAIGMSRAARVLGQADYQEGKTESALRHTVLASCLDPHGVFGAQRTRVTDFAHQINVEVTHREDVRTHKRLLADLHASVVQHTGIFAALDYIAADRTHHIDQLFTHMLANFARD